jgi:Rad3-related DNA helicase
MKKLFIYVISGVFLLSAFSCGNKKAENLADLKKKYDGKEFKNCDKFLEAMNESFDVYFSLIDKAYEGNEEAKKEMEEFDKYFNSFDSQAEKFEKECPEKFEEFQKNLEKKMEEKMEKLMKIYGLDELYNNTEMEEGEYAEDSIAEQVVE